MREPLMHGWFAVFSSFEMRGKGSGYSKNKITERGKKKAKFVIAVNTNTSQ
jgi:hypothetical protein